jgi:hypothetical protein
MMVNKFTKNCPTCNIEMVYSRKDTLKESITKNRQCRTCSKKGKQPAFYVDGKIPEKVLNKISKTWFKKGDRPKNADTRKGKTFEELYGVEKAQLIKEKYSAWEKTKEGNLKRKETMRKRWEEGVFDNIDRTRSEETKQIHRLNFIKKLKKTHKNFHPPYNENACKYFDYLMKKENINIKHALNGGEFFINELGFWVDGYDEENNTVYEFDEKHHFNKKGELKKKDVQRQKLIMEHLKCKFIRIKYSEVDIPT